MANATSQRWIISKAESAEKSCFSFHADGGIATISLLYWLKGGGLELIFE